MATFSEGLIAFTNELVPKKTAILKAVIIKNID
jgi:hypothetical protein